jgi:anti-sigma factor RsiW
MRYLGGHLGLAVSALVDGQLDPASTERAWAHVRCCPSCHRQVEREGWVKTQLAAMPGDSGPPAQLLGSLYGLGRDESVPQAAPPDPAAAWAAVEELEQRGRGRRRTGIAIAGAGSVSVAVLGLASLTGSTLGIGGAPTATPSSSAPTTVIAPVARVHGRLPFSATPGSSAEPSSGPRQGEDDDGLSR